MTQTQAVAQVSDPKWHFLEEVFLSLSIRDAFATRTGRRVYMPGIKTKDRSSVQAVAHSALRELESRYENAVDEETHIQNINALASRVSEACGHLLNEGRPVFGVAQKLLNSWLKYLWCVGRIAEPPHGPFDNDIIGRLALPPGVARQWTGASEADYRAWIAAAKQIDRATGESLAAWELREWGL